MTSSVCLDSISRTTARALFRPGLLLLALPFLVFSLGGCGHRGNVDLLEARLRQQQDQFVDLQWELEKAREKLDVAEKESTTLRDQLASQKKAAILPEQADTLFRTKGIRFNSLMTGGLNRDDAPGDELLAVLLQPHDADGELMKVPGSVQLELLDPTRLEGQQVIGHWEFPASQYGENWHGGFIGSGYRYQLPWQQTPTSPELVLHGSLTTTDGRRFDTSTVIKVNPSGTSAAREAQQAKALSPAPPARLDSLHHPAKKPRPIQQISAEAPAAGVVPAGGFRDESARPALEPAVPDFKNWLNGESAGK
jgi:hypothetical protein